MHSAVETRNGNVHYKMWSVVESLAESSVHAMDPTYLPTVAFLRVVVDSLTHTVFRHSE